MLFAMPCFGISIGIYVQNLRIQEAMFRTNTLNVPYDGPEGSIHPDNGAAVYIAIIGIALLFGFRRVAAVLGILMVGGMLLYFALSLTHPSGDWARYLLSDSGA
jgi:hypothetical protein